MYVKAFIVNVNKCLKPFFLEQHINIVNIVTLQSVCFICTPALHNGNQTKNMHMLSSSCALYVNSQ